jgi:hypothetical protein
MFVIFPFLRSVGTESLEVLLSYFNPGLLGSPDSFGGRIAFKKLKRCRHMNSLLMIDLRNAEILQI